MPGIIKTSPVYPEDSKATKEEETNYNSIHENI